MYMVSTTLIWFLREQLLKSRRQIVIQLSQIVLPFMAYSSAQTMYDCFKFRKANSSFSYGLHTLYILERKPFRPYLNYSFLGDNLHLSRRRLPMQNIRWYGGHEQSIVSNLARKPKMDRTSLNRHFKRHHIAEQVRYLMRGINGEKLGLTCLNVGKILTI